MVSLETERRLADFFLQVADGERQVELARQSLCENPDFEPYSVFKMIDKLDRASIGIFELRDYLDYSRVLGSEFEVSQVIKQYDSDSDLRLTIGDFNQLVLPSARPTLRELALSRPSYPRVTVDVEYLFNRVIEKEIQYQRNNEDFKRTLSSRYDFNLLDAFKLIDRPGSAFITVDKLYSFLRRNGVSVFDEDMDAILRRLDIDADGRLSYSEFIEAVLPSEATYRPADIPSYRSSPTRRAVSPRYSSPLKRSGSPVRGGLLSSSSLSSSPSLRSSARSPARSRSNLTLADQEELVSTFKTQINLARDLESAKDELALRADFNLEDAWRMFDLDDKGFITVIELESALYELGIRPSRDDLYLLLKHFGKLSETRLRFGDFSEVFLPKREDYARLVRSRTPYNVPLHERRRIFSLDTLSKFTAVIRLHLESEGVAESLRQRLSRRAYFSLHDAFQAVDRDRNGFITLDEFQGILQEHGMYVTGKDLESLMERYDKNMDGRVSYSEFLEEVTPKSPRKY